MKIAVIVKAGITEINVSFVWLVVVECRNHISTSKWFRGINCVIIH